MIHMNMNGSFNSIAIMINILEWAVIGLLAYKTYKKRTVNPKVWKVMVATFVGLFAFTIDVEWFDTLVKIPVLPLGVWILYGVLNRKEDRWDTYRPYAWIGFFGNAFVLAGALIGSLVYGMVYPQDQADTYLSNVDGASILSIHQGAGDVSLNEEVLKKQIPSMKQEVVEGARWYEEMYLDTEGSKTSNERFPYMLTGTSSQWGSGLDPVIFLEQDGKGLLITTPREQYYFRSRQSVFEEVRP